MAAKKKHAGGRPRTQMTDENIAKILRAVELGMWPERAALMHGISGAAMRKHKERHPEFVTALEMAEAKGESEFLGRMYKLSDTVYQACAFMLERRWPDRWAKREPSVEVNVDARRAPPTEPPDGDWEGYAKQLVKLTERNGTSDTGSTG